MFKGDDRQTLQSLIDNGTITEESMKTPQLALDAIGTTVKSKEHFWLSGTNCCPMLGNSQTRAYICCPCTSVTLSLNANFPTPTFRKCSKSWSCSLQYIIMRPGTGSANRTSPSSHTSSCSLSLNCLNPGVSSTKKQRKRDELTLHS